MHSGTKQDEGTARRHNGQGRAAAASLEGELNRSCAITLVEARIHKTPPSTMLELAPEIKAAETLILLIEQGAAESMFNEADSTERTAEARAAGQAARSIATRMLRKAADLIEMMASRRSTECSEAEELS